MEKISEKHNPYFVGRKEELEFLYKTFQDVVEHKVGRVVFIQGEYGVGKTELVERFLTKIEKQYPEALIGKGKCLMELETSGLTPFTKLFQDLAKQGIENRLITGDFWDFTKEVAPAWLDIFTLGLASATVKTIDASIKLAGKDKYTKDNVNEQFLNILQKLSSKKPLIVFLDDLQWSDTSSLHLLFYISRYLTDNSVFIVGTYRPVEALETGANSSIFRELRANLIRYGAKEMILEKGIDVDAYLSERYPHHKFPVELIEQVKDATQGHALYLSQLFFLLEEQRKVYSDISSSGNHVWKFKGDLQTKLDVPLAVTMVLDERIRLVQEELRNALVIASVEGESFTAQVVSSLDKVNDDTVYNFLDALEKKYRLVKQADTIRAGKEVVDLYVFAHRFFREHIYEELSSGKRRIMHRKVGECLETLFEDKEIVAAQLARHFKEANIYDKSLKYSLIAAQHENECYSWDESQYWCQFGIKLSEQDAENQTCQGVLIDLIELSAYNYFCTGDYQKSAETYEGIIERISSTMPFSHRLINDYIMLTEININRNNLSDAQKFFNKSKEVSISHNLSDTEGWVEILLLQAVLEERVGNNLKSTETLRNAISLAEKLASTARLASIKAKLYKLLGTSLSNLSKYEEAYKTLLSGLEFAKEVDDKVSIVFILGSIVGDYMLHVNKLDESETYLTSALEIAHTIGDKKGIIRSQAIFGDLRLGQKRYYEAVPILQNAIEIAIKYDIQYKLSYMYAKLAEAFAALDKLEEAKLSAEKALLYSSRDYPLTRAYALVAQAGILKREEHFDQACSTLTEVIEIYNKSGDLHFEALARCSLAKIYLSQNMLDEFNLNVSTALNLFQQLGLEHEVQKTLILQNMALS